MKRMLMSGVAAAVLAVAGCQTTQPSEEGPAFSAAEFKAHHAEIREHLGHVDEWAQQLPSQPPERQRQTMTRIARFFSEHILVHAGEEEATLYPKADRQAGAKFTASMRYEHAVVNTWVQELQRIAASAEPDASAFARRTQRLLGLLEAHLGAEEEVVVPVLAGRN